MKTIAIDTNYPPANALILSAPDGGKPLAQPLQAVDMCADVLRVFFVGNNFPAGNSTLVIAGRGIGEVRNVFLATGTKVEDEVAWDFSISLATRELAEFIGAKENVALKVGVSATIEGGSATEWQMLWNVSRTAIGDNDLATLPHVQTLVSQADTAAQSATASAESAATKAAEASTSATNARDQADRARGYADQVNLTNFYSKAAADDLFATQNDLNTLTSPASEMSRGTVLLAGGVDDAGAVSVPTASLVKSYVDSIVSAMYHYRGSVASYSDLPSSGQMAGDVWNVTAAYGDYPAGTNFAWTGDAWDSLGGVVNIATTTTPGVVKLGTPDVLDATASWLAVNANGQAGIRRATATVYGAIKLATSTTLGDKMGYVGLNANGQAGIGLANSAQSGVARLSFAPLTTEGTAGEYGRITRDNVGKLWAMPAGNGMYGAVSPTTSIDNTSVSQFLSTPTIKTLLAGVVHTAGDETIIGTKTFNNLGGIELSIETTSTSLTPFGVTFGGNSYSWGDWINNETFNIEIDKTVKKNELYNSGRIDGVFFSQNTTGEKPFTLQANSAQEGSGNLAIKFPVATGKTVAYQEDLHAVGDVVMRASNSAPAVTGQTWTPAGTVTTAGTGAATIYYFQRTA